MAPRHELHPDTIDTAHPELNKGEHHRSLHILRSEETSTVSYIRTADDHPRISQSHDVTDDANIDLETDASGDVEQDDLPNAEAQGTSEMTCVVRALALIFTLT